jgi:hypothetical protein
MKKPKHDSTTFNAFRARQKVRSGAHMVLDRDDLLPGHSTDRKGTEYRSLTQARKAAKSGQAIVRVRDGLVVSVK